MKYDYFLIRRCSWSAVISAISLHPALHHIHHQYGAVCAEHREYHPNATRNEAILFQRRWLSATKYDQKQRQVRLTSHVLWDFSLFFSINGNLIATKIFHSFSDTCYFYDCRLYLD